VAAVMSGENFPFFGVKGCQFQNEEGSEGTIDQVRVKDKVVIFYPSPNDELVPFMLKLDSESTSWRWEGGDIVIDDEHFGSRTILDVRT